MQDPQLLVEGGPWRLYVLIGCEAEMARIWAKTRGVDAAQVVLVRGPCSLVKLRRVAGPGVALVPFESVSDPGMLPAQLGRLRSQGAVWVSPRWWPDDTLAVLK